MKIFFGMQPSIQYISLSTELTIKLNKNDQTTQGHSRPNPGQ